MIVVTFMTEVTVVMVVTVVKEVTEVAEVTVLTVMTVVTVVTITVTKKKQKKILWLERKKSMLNKKNIKNYNKKIVKPGSSGRKLKESCDNSQDLF